MSIIIVLMAASLILALVFLALFTRAVRRGQFDDMETPAMRMLTDDDDDRRGANQKGKRVHE